MDMKPTKILQDTPHTISILTTWREKFPSDCVVDLCFGCLGVASTSVGKFEAFIATIVFDPIEISGPLTEREPVERRRSQVLRDGGEQPASQRLQAALQRLPELHRVHDEEPGEARPERLRALRPADRRRHGRAKDTIE